MFAVNTIIKTICILSFVVCLVLVSCEYKPEETIYFPSEKADTPSYSIEFPYEGDTIRIAHLPELNVGFRCEGHEILKIRYLIDGDELFYERGTDSVFTYVNLGYITNFYDTFRLNGQFVFTLIATVKGEAGSIADNYNFESFNFEGEWVFIYEDPGDQISNQEVTRN